MSTRLSTSGAQETPEGTDPLPDGHSGFFPFSLASQKDHPWRRETVKGALMVMYSCVASYCHPQMLLIHVDNPITTKIIHHYSSSCQVTLGSHRHAMPR